MSTSPHHFRQGLAAFWLFLSWLGLLFLGAWTLPAQTDVTGFWILRVPNGGITYFDLKEAGESVTGTYVNGGPVRALSGSFIAGKLRLAISPQREYAGAVDGNKITLTAPIQGVLERCAREAMYPPKLPLPELQDVPDNGLARTPPMGWNSWNKFQANIDDATIRGMADAMVSSGMSKVGYNYIVVDEGWSSSRDADGKIIGNARFPDMKALGAYIHSKGLKFGTYTSPGPQSCGGYQGSYDHESDDAKTFAAWDVDYLKYDWCTAAAAYQSTREESQGASQKMGQALVDTGRPIVYSIHSMGEVWKWGAKAGANLWRTTNDIADSWQSMERIGFNQLDLVDYTKPGHWNDPDMLEIGNGGMNGDEYRTHMSLWCLLAAPLMAGNDLRTMTEETKSILMNTEVIAIDQDMDVKPVRRIDREGRTEVWVRPLRDRQTARFGVDHSVAVGLFNRGDQPADVSVRWEDLHIGAVVGAKALSARDLWKHQDVPVTGDRYTASVPAHGVVVLKVTAAPTR
jgi:alpha-galactosidase